MIEQRARGLAQTLVRELSKLDGVHLWTDPTPDRSAAIVIFKPGSLDPRALGAALGKENIVVTTRGANGANRASAPHMFNTMDDVDRLLGVLARKLKTGA